MNWQKVEIIERSQVSRVLLRGQEKWWVTFFEFQILNVQTYEAVWRDMSWYGEGDRKARNESKKSQPCSAYHAGIVVKTSLGLRASQSFYVQVGEGGL